MTNPTLHSIFNKNDAKASQLEALGSVLGRSPIIFFEFEETDLPFIQEALCIYGNNLQTKTQIRDVKQKVISKSDSECQKEL